MDDYFRIVIIGSSQVGKSWLANRLVKGIHDQIEDYQNKDLEEIDQVFEEKDQIEQIHQECKDNNFTQKTFDIDEKFFLQIIETYGIGTYKDIPIDEQIKKIVQSQGRVDYFIYVNPCDYQLQGEILSNFRIASDVCTPEKLFVYLSRDFIYEKNSKGYDKIKNTWNEYNKDQKYCKGLYTNAKELSKYFQVEYKRRIEKDINVLVYSKQYNQLAKQLWNEQKYKLENQQEVLDPQKKFDVAIIDFELLFEKSKNQTLLNQLDELFFRKCVVYVSESLINDFFNTFYQQHRRIQFMKYNISIETLRILSWDQIQIDKSYFLKFDFKYA